jgi:two-component system alkaline phosphatase synthesis response regulator PhoP
LSDTPAHAAARPQGEEGSLADARILLVDDNEQNLELLQAYLDELGCEVVTARDGHEALRLAAEEPPDIVLLDVMMPRMSGFQTCVHLKNDARTRDVPVIMVTALSDISDVERAVECGADDFLSKPVNRLELLMRVRSLIRVRRLKQEVDSALSAMRRLGGGEPPR